MRGMVSGDRRTRGGKGSGTDDEDEDRNDDESPDGQTVGRVGHLVPRDQSADEGEDGRVEQRCTVDGETVSLLAVETCGGLKEKD